MRNSTLRAITASVAAVAMIVSVGTSPVLARGGGGHGGAGGVRAGGGGHGFHAGGGFHPGGHTYATVTTAVTTAAVTTAAVTMAAPVRQIQFLC